MSEKGTLNFTNKISVLLVEHERGSLIYTTRLLEACSYKVVAVKDASTALWILSERKQEFDFMLADIHLPDLDPFTLLLLTSNMGIRTILMSAERDDMVLRRGLENGAYMVLEKPFFVETMKYLWQHVMREKISNEASKDSNESAESEESKGKSPQDDIENEIRIRKKMARDGRKGKNKEGFDQSDSNSRVKRRTCTEWTEELHQKFVDAVLKLGEGRCYPKNILEMMKVPGLTRMQVASHLQKCRNRKWQPPQPNPPRYVETPSSPRKFGSMPITPKERTGPGQSNRQDNKQVDEPPSGQQPGFDLNTIEQRPIHPQPYLVPPTGFDINPLATNSSAPNSTQLTFSSVPTRKARVSNVVNQNEMSNLNVQQGYIPSRQKLSENFFEFLPKKDEAIKHSYDPPEGLMSNQSSRSQRQSLDFNIAFSELQW